MAAVVEWLSAVVDRRPRTGTAGRVERIGGDSTILSSPPCAVSPQWYWTSNTPLPGVLDPAIERPGDVLDYSVAIGARRPRLASGRLSADHLSCRSTLDHTKPCWNKVFIRLCFWRIFCDKSEGK